MRHPDMFNCCGKTAVVTGGAGLYGYAISEALCEIGANVVVASRSDMEFNNKCAELKEKYSICHFKLDISCEESINRFFDRINNDLAGIDILVNNAVTPCGKSLDNTEYSEWDKALHGNVLSLFIMCQKAVEGMKRKKNGAIINISSIWGIVSPDYGIYEEAGMSPNPIAYSFIKGGVNMFTRSLASAVAVDGIRVNSISPGGIADNTDTEFYRNAYQKKVPMGRWANPNDIKGAVIYLASEASSYVTGTNLVVDGGYTIR